MKKAKMLMFTIIVGIMVMVSGCGQLKGECVVCGNKGPLYSVIDKYDGKVINTTDRFCDNCSTLYLKEMRKSFSDAPKAEFERVAMK